MAKSFSCEGVSAVITGASAGLGVEFARQLAPRARRLVLVARREPELLVVREEMLRLHPKLEVIVCPADVSTDDGRQRILAKIAESQSAINLLINNAGLGDYGLFETADTARIQQQIDVNITGLVQLTHALLPLLRQHRPAGILNVSSLAGTLPLPSMAIYAATKAFVTSLTEALRIELLDEGIRVAAVCPGPTPTTFGQTARRAEGEDANRTGHGVLIQPNDRVVADGLATLERGAATVYPGAGVAISATLFRLLPRWLLRLFLTRRFRAAR
jgi:uncharacterized protein